MALLSALNSQLSTAFAFEGRIVGTVTRGGEVTPLLYTAGTNFLRVEVTDNSRPNSVDILDSNSGEMVLLFPNNRSFVRLKAGENVPAPPAPPTMPPVPAAHIGPTNLSGMPDMPQMPQMPPGVGLQGGAGVPPMPVGGGIPMIPMPPPMMEKMELMATGDKTNLLGFACEKFEIRQRGEVMEIWATDKLLPFQPYMQNQLPRFGPRMIEEQWGQLLKARKMFPLLAVLRFEVPAPPGSGTAPPSPERIRFEVTAITQEKITDGALFQPPPDYLEIQPLSF
jgi:hypothetical protein